MAKVYYEEDIKKAIGLAQKYQVGKLYVFGSLLNKSPDQANDYDLAVENVAPEKFFEFYGKLIMSLSKNVDLIDLTGRSDKFKNIILEEGKVIYDKRSA